MGRRWWEDVKINVFSDVEPVMSRPKRVESDSGDDATTVPTFAERERHRRASSALNHFSRLPLMIPELEFFVFYGGACLIDALLASVLVVVKCFLLPWRIELKDACNAFLISVGFLTFWSFGPDNLLYATLYHYIRTTSMIKLYVLFSMLEVSDKLLASLILRSQEAMLTSIRRILMWGAPVSQPGPKQSPRRIQDVFLLTGSTLIASFCVATDALVLLLHVITLNVAINSEGNSLIALLISNNFMEMKSVVFKKYTAEALFQVCCSDVVERVQLIVFILTMMTQHFNKDGLGSIAFEDVLIILAAEVLIDIVKHYFVCTFNGLSLEVYSYYSGLLLYDVATENILWRTDVRVSCTDPRVDQELFSYLIKPKKNFVPNPASRIGFVPAPYTALLLWSVHPLLQRSAAHNVAALVLSLCVLALAKLLIASLVQGMSCRFMVRTLCERTRPMAASRLSGGGEMLPSKKLFGVSPHRTRSVWDPNVSDADAVDESTDDHLRNRRVVVLPYLYYSLLRVDRFDLNAGKWTK
jgi:hypothetical protein